MAYYGKGSAGQILTDNVAPTMSNWQGATSLPAFLAYLATADTNATGNGITYTFGGGNALTKVFDQTSSFTTGGTFTAPTTGIYFFQFQLGFGNLTSAMSQLLLRIVTTKNTFNNVLINPGATMTSNNTLTQCGSVICNMSSGDTATFIAQITGGVGNTAEVLDPITGVYRSYVCGNLIT